MEAGAALRKTILLILLLTAGWLVQASPAPLRALQLGPAQSGDEGPASLVPVPVPAGVLPVRPPDQADLDRDGRPESLQLAGGRLSILSGAETVWLSPPAWTVAQAAFTDLDRDGIPEAALLIWRPFQPWPVDRWLPHGGRIAGFHDVANNSCHIILIGRRRDGYGELWAGSALADPVTAFAAADLNGDGIQELVTLEGRYAASGSGPVRDLKVWEWNGFGFTVVSTVRGAFSTLVLVRAEDGRVLILVP
jgi:hypothetical protein